MQQPQFMPGSQRAGQLLQEVRICLGITVLVYVLAGCSDSKTPLDSLQNGSEVDETVTYSVSGLVTDRHGEGVPEVVLTFGDFGTATSDSEGKWNKSDLEGEITITAGRHGWFLQPDSITVESETTDLEFSATPSEIAFVSDRGGEESDGFFSIYVMNADGSNVTRLASTGRDNEAPAWSPDGRRIAFQSFDGLQEDIYVMNADGSGVTRLTDSGADDLSPTWSPDGSRIAFISYRDGNPRIYVMDADGDNQTVLAGGFAYSSPINWSPVGNYVAYSAWGSSADGILGVHRWNESTSVTGVLTFDGWNEYDDFAPVWSLDGERIAFHRVGAGIWVVDVEVDEDLVMTPSNLTRVTIDDNFARSPAWTPDGRIVYESGQEIYVIDTDGTNLIQLTDTVEPNLDPAWSPVW